LAAVAELRELGRKRPDLLSTEPRESVQHSFQRPDWRGSKMAVSMRITGFGITIVRAGSFSAGEKTLSFIKRDAHNRSPQ
jgi:hypothetical protein